MHVEELRQQRRKKIRWPWDWTPASRIPRRRAAPPAFLSNPERREPRSCRTAPASPGRSGTPRRSTLQRKTNCRKPPAARPRRSPRARSTAVFAVRIPRFEATLFRAPPRKALESTNSTAGPGIRHKTTSVAANIHHVAGATVQLIYKLYDRRAQRPRLANGHQRFFPQRFAQLQADKVFRAVSHHVLHRSGA